MMFAVLAVGLALAALVYCGVTSFKEFQAGRLAWAVVGGVLAVLVPAALGFLAVIMAQFFGSGGF